MGRRKIEMKMVTNNSSRQVTFSKRRTGLFKKANELATLCSVEVAIIVFSPGGKPFSFGHPSVESVMRQFLNQNPQPNDGTLDHVKSLREAKVNVLNQQLFDVLKQLQAEKKRGEMLGKTMKAKSKLKSESPIKELGLHELEILMGSMEKLKKNVKTRVNEIEASSSLLLLAKNSVKETDMFVAKKI